MHRIPKKPRSPIQMEVKIKKEEVKKPVDKKKIKKKDKKDEKITDKNNDKFVFVFIYFITTDFINCYFIRSLIKVYSSTLCIAINCKV